MKEAAGDVYAGVLVGAAHSVYFVKKWLSTSVLRPALHALGLPATKEVRGDATLPDGSKPELKVIGVGYGRTGTYSLALALDELGFPTLHTQHLYEMDEIFDMWTNEIILPSIEARNATLGRPNFDLIAEHGFTGTTDLPMALYFEELSEAYPECKFVLTVRESSQVWFKSWDMLTKSITRPTRYASFLTGVKRLGLYLRWLFAIVNQDDSYLTVSYPLPDQNMEAAIASYEAHNRRVREVIPSERLLEYSVKQGWEPLCDFLGVDECPTKAFPKTNSARSVQVQSISAMLFPFAAVVVSLYFVSLLLKRMSKDMPQGPPNLNVIRKIEAPQRMRKRNLRRIKAA